MLKIFRLTVLNHHCPQDAYRPDILLRLGGIHFQLRNFSESIFYLQQCVRIEPTCAEAYSNLGNAIKVLYTAPPNSHLLDFFWDTSGCFIIHPRTVVRLGHAMAFLLAPLPSNNN